MKVKFEYDTEAPGIKVRVNRTDLPNGEKNIFQEYFDGSKWLKGRPAEVLVRPYNHDFWKDAKSTGTVYFVEGEKCADCLAHLGLISTTVIGGASGWKSEYAKFFKDQRVVIIPDNDSPGFSFSEKVAADLESVCESVKVVELPGLGHKEDVFDFFNKHGRTVDDLNREVQKAPERKKSYFSFIDHVHERKSEFIIKPYIPLGHITLIDGDPGRGKSQFCLALACMGAKGNLAKFFETDCPSFRTVVLSEDSPEYVIKQRLRVNGYPQNESIIVLSEYIFLNTDGILVLEKEIIRNNPKLVLIDTLFSFTESQIDIHRGNEVSQFLRPLKALAERYQIAVICVRHLRKEATAIAQHAGLGSGLFAGTARSVLQVGRMSDGRFGVGHVKCNLAEEGTGITFKLVEGRVCDFEIPTKKITLSDLRPPDGDSDGPVEKCAEAIIAALSDGPRSSNEIKAICVQLGFTERTIKSVREKYKNRIKDYQEDRCHWYKLVSPGEGSKSSDGAIGPIGQNAPSETSEGLKGKSKPMKIKGKSES